MIIITSFYVFQIITSTIEFHLKKNERVPFSANSTYIFNKHFKNLFFSLTSLLTTTQIFPLAFHLFIQKFKFVFTILLVFLFNFMGYSQDQQNFIHLKPILDHDGVSYSNSLEDDYGYIWLLHGTGISKYDGYNYSFIPFEDILGEDYSQDRDFKFKKDAHGYIWLSSFNGELTRIDKNGIYRSFKKEMKQNKGRKQVLSTASKNHNVWFGTHNGELYNYNYKTNKIDSITSIPNYKYTSQKIISIVQDQENEVWVSTNKGNIYKYSLTDQNITELSVPYNEHSDNIRIIGDKNEHIWIATSNQGLYIYDPITHLFEHFNFPKNPLFNLRKNMFISLFCDSSGLIWAGTDGDGLYQINPDTKQTFSYQSNEFNKFSLSSNTILKINEDSHKNIWVFTKGGDINILPNSNNKIGYQSGFIKNSPTRVLSSIKSTDGTLWIGTDGKGLNRVLANGLKEQFGLEPSSRNPFAGKFIQSLVEDQNGQIWIGTYQDGLWVFDKRKNKFKKIRVAEKQGIAAIDIRFLYRDSKNRIWVNTGIGIFIYSANQKLLASFKGHMNGLYGEISQSICEDENGTVWVGINLGGLFEFQEDEKDITKSYFKQHLYYDKIRGDSRNYNIGSMASDYDGNIWIVTISGSLIKYNLLNQTYTSFLEREEFKRVGLSAVLVDNPDNIWLSSNKGILHYNTKSSTIKSFYQTDGLQGNNFLKRSSFKDKEGRLYFGGNNGLNYFLPENMQKEETAAQLHINNIEVLNQPVQSIIPNQLTEGIEQVTELKLASNQSSFSFQFSALDNILNSNFHYAYRLKGFSNQWIVPKGDRIATYTNIPYGNYTFEVKAGSKKGKWDIPIKSIEIKISPPWWHQTWAYILYFVLLIVVGYGVLLWVRMKKRLVSEEIQSNQDKELYALKMNFFTKMSHEIQTPLTLILGPIEDMLKRAEDRGNLLLKQRLTMIVNNAKRLSRIAMELTSIRNKELGRLRLRASQEDLIKDLKNISLSFEEQACFKQIEFTQVYQKSSINMWYDSDKIEHVIYNLLSNAFKFTPRGGSVKMQVNYEDPHDVSISITDSGPGIPQEELDHIFILFYQSEVGKQAKGTGIGLALTKELVELHHGQICVNSSDKGTCFTVKLSTDESIFSQTEKVNIENQKVLVQETYTESETSEETINEQITDTSKETKTLLIVEDNYEMQILLRNVFSKSYKVLIADNGKEGVLLAKKNSPDLIISDVMMPIMDGVEMSRILQKTTSTLHIPIILLTARNTNESKIKGLKSGAIEYIHKPFHIEELLLKVKNIITSREKVLSKYKTELISTPKNMETKSPDDLFLEELVNEINKQLDNPDFRLEDLSNVLNMSYSVIFRKCQSITGKTLVDFVRVIRLKKAAIFIVKYGYGVSESAYMVGFNNPKYFSKCFKKEFSKSPNTFKKEALKMGIDDFLKEYNLNDDS